MRTIRMGLLTTLLLLIVSTTTSALANPGEQNRILGFQISPDPASPGNWIDVNISFSLTVGSTPLPGETGYFCLYAPNATGEAIVNMPGQIELDYVYNEVKQTASFLAQPQAQSGATCSPEPNQTAQLYEAAVLPDGQRGYDGSFSTTINSGTPANTYKWTLWLPDDGYHEPIIAHDFHTVLGPTAVKLQQSGAQSEPPGPAQLLIPSLMLGLFSLYQLRRRMTS